MIELVETYFDKLSQDLFKRNAVQLNRAQITLHGSLDKLKDKSDQINELINNLQGDKSLKALIHLLSTSFLSEQQSCHIEFESLNSLLHAQKLDISTDDNVLHSINLEIVK